MEAVHAGPYRTGHRFGKRLQHCLQQRCSSECNSPWGSLGIVARIPTKSECQLKMQYSLL